MFTKNINNNQKKTSLKKLFALLFLFLATACEDYGCIDSDDFGEYEIYTFPVSDQLSIIYPFNFIIIFILYKLFNLIAQIQIPLLLTLNLIIYFLIYLF